MYELGKVFTSKFVGTGPSSYKKRIYQAAVSQRLRNTTVMCLSLTAISSQNNDNCNSLQHLLTAQQQQPSLLQEVIMESIFTTKYLKKKWFCEVC